MNMKEAISKATDMPINQKARKYDLVGMFQVIDILRGKGYKWAVIAKFLNDNGINLGLETIRGYYYKRETLNSN